MLQKITTTMLIGSSLVHLLCCGLPLLLGLTSIAAWAGWNGAIQISLFNDIDLVNLHQYEGMMVISSGALIMLTAMANFVASKLNCVEQNVCHHEPCDKEKTFAQKVFVVALGFWLLNLLHFML